MHNSSILHRTVKVIICEVREVIYNENKGYTGKTNDAKQAAYTFKDLFLQLPFIPAKKISLAGFLAKGQIQLHIIIKFREVKNPLIFFHRTTPLQ